MDKGSVPVFDDAGINIFDPHDSAGRKTAYISLLQLDAIRSVLGRTGGVAVDVGCGYGRMTARLAELGFDSLVGIDPSQRVIEAARALFPTPDFRVGALPDLPLEHGSVSCAFLLNVMRSLHLMGVAGIAESVARYVEPGGHVVVIDNLRRGDARYMREEDLTGIFARGGLELASRRAIRGARWPWIYLVRYGLIPTSAFPMLSRLERRLMERFAGPFSWQYANYLWVFTKRS
ncbi:class I SAM-dependent methyltransferase [Lysobacter sp. SG-8]|uniref:Class I SAM-dependent methyltransferase n=1 Tax=Marilutibacter penaei TaxID=2759900 RepID=A0A7W3U440_9GAMM|nr:class I SAM-dependent methyltransferase [Lysobacter penaei]MBB1088587.1 class I SAM-dependent methyltransferase [Lysobacter penaei]